MKTVPQYPIFLARILGLGVAFLLCPLFTGCATTAMKGTPFYTGEYSAQRGPAEDRVNIWPLLYYHDPALSVLWPIAELTDDHFAIRPLLSIYGRNNEKPIVNVLWPLARFDAANRNYRIFPAYWGKDHAVLFPFYWNLDRFAGETSHYDALLPLISYYRIGQEYNTHLLWPVVQVRDLDGRKGWRVWPLYGNYREDLDYYRFFLWPLGHQWSGDTNDQRGHCLLPLYFHFRDRKASSFFSLPFSAGWQNGKDSASWKLALPFFYAQSNTDLSRFYSLPWSSAKHRDGTFWQLLPPLMFRYRNAEEQALVTPLFAHGRSNDGSTAWSSLIPFVYNRRSGDTRLVATLLGGWQSRPDDLSWVVLPLLSGGKATAARNDLWLIGPVGHLSWGEESGPSHLLPVFYYNPESGSMLSPLYMTWTDADDRYRAVPPLLSGWRRDKSNELREVITPLFGFNRDPSGFVYPLTPLAGVFTGKHSGGWLFPLWSQSRDRQSNNVDGTFLLWGNYSQRNQRRHAAWFPFFGYDNYGPITELNKAETDYVRKGKEFWCLPACWYQNTRVITTYQTPVKHDLQSADRPTGSDAATVTPPDQTVNVERVKKHGIFPLWQYSRKDITRQDAPRSETGFSLGLLLYDYTHKRTPAEELEQGEANDYTRSRILWRLWHYERLNGDVSVDIFPAITYDSKTDGFRKVSFFWRLFRYERNTDGIAADILFLPVAR